VAKGDGQLLPSGPYMPEKGEGKVECGWVRPASMSAHHSSHCRALEEAAVKVLIQEVLRLSSSLCMPNI
jgi:hypothetical protein